MYKVIEITDKVRDYKGFDLNTNNLFTLLLLAGILYLAIRK